MGFRKGETVEFCSTVTCAVLATSCDDLPKINVPVETQGETLGRGSYSLLPGEIPVFVSLQVPNNGLRDLVIAVPEGFIAKVSYETDPDTGAPVIKHYRGMSIRIDGKS